MQPGRGERTGSIYVTSSKGKKNRKCYLLKISKKKPRFYRAVK